MELETIILNEVSPRKKYHLYVESEKKKKKDENELIYKTSSETLETNLWLPEGNVEGGIN